MKKAGFKRLKSRHVFKGRIIDVYSDQLRHADGKIITRELVKHSGAVVMIPMLDPETLILVSQFRYPARKYIWEFPAGTLEKKESPLSCARRELREETGYRAAKWKKLLSFYTAPGFCDEYMHLFLARDLTPALGQLDEDEYLTPAVFKISAVDRMIKKGDIVDAKTILAFYFIQESLRQKR